MTNETPIAAYINAHRGELTYTDIAKRSGGQITRAQISSYTTRPLKDMPTTKAMRGLIQGLGVPAHEVVLAFARSLETDLGSGAPGAHDLVVHGAADLPSESQRLIVNTAKQLLWWQDQVEGGDSDTPELTPEQLRLAAQDAPDESGAEQERARLDERGEESQDTGNDEPA
ncbi:hypothetical protein [Galactobacter sp.]|uniref:hypothetical protein n=1 Tax=Galactobacter sp. TaxID=2676125 RepID=UPI0025C4FC30|nr:hypothetical protein [Galactobacter sp.]